MAEDKDPDTEPIELLKEISSKLNDINDKKRRQRVSTESCKNPNLF